MRTPVRTPVCTPVCTPDFSNAYISDKNEDNATKLSGYDPLGVEKDYSAEGPSDRPKAHQGTRMKGP